MDPETDSFGGRMRAARKARGLSLKALGDTLDLGVSYLSDLETGRRRPNEQNLNAICAALELDVDEMAGLAGVIGHEATQYLERNPDVIVQLRRRASGALPPAGPTSNRRKKKHG